MVKLSRIPSGEPEIFASIQGEGASAGLPSVVVRPSLCNTGAVAVRWEIPPAPLPRRAPERGSRAGEASA